MKAPWKIVHVELSEPLPALHAGTREGGVLVVFWWHGIPLGQTTLHLTQLPLTPLEVREWALEVIAPAVADRLMPRGFRASLPVKKRLRTPEPPPNVDALAGLQEPLRRLEAALPPTSSLPSPADAAVIVCTRERPELLAQCLRSLRRLACTPEEILVVDNAPVTDSTRRLVEGMPRVRYVLEPRPGLSVARNAGLRHASSSIVAFTDDDVEVHPEWLGRLLGAFEEPQVMAATGLVLPAELETEAQLIFQQSQGRDGWPYRVLDYDRSFFEQMKPYGAPVWHLGAGANMAFRREIFDRVGLFDERLGAGASGCSEDSELWYRVLAAGYTCRYEPAAAVFHYHRRDLPGLKHQMQQYMRGHVAALLFQAARHRHAGNLYRAAGTLPLHYARLIARRIRRGREASTATLAAQLRGCAAGVAFYLRNRSEPPVAEPPVAEAAVSSRDVST